MARPARSYANKFAYLFIPVDGIPLSPSLLSPFFFLGRRFQVVLLGACYCAVSFPLILSRTLLVSFNVLLFSTVVSASLTHVPVSIRPARSK